MQVDAVFLDLDDTLYPYDPCNTAGKEAAWETARDRGYDLDRGEFMEFYRAGRAEVKRELAGRAAAHERYLYFKRALEIHTGDHRPRDALALGDAYWDAFLDEIEPFDGMREALEEFHDRGIAIAVLSNLTARIQLEKLALLGVEEQVDLLVTSEELGVEKPASAMFTYPLVELDVSRDRTLMVGDSIEADIEGGNGVGLTTVLFDHGGETGRGRAAPDHQVSSFAELREVVDRA